MKGIFEKIWDLALPYQDKRDDKGHAKITLNYARELVELENGNEDIIIPSIILHDTGWSQLPRKKRFTIFDKNATKDERLSVRYQHQNVGVEIGKKILNEVNYTSDLVDKILEIISEHDTREGFISKDEGLVRDADKLWRFSKEGFTADIIRNEFTSEALYKKLKTKIELPNFFYSDTAKQIAYEELNKKRRI